MPFAPWNNYGVKDWKSMLQYTMHHIEAGEFRISVLCKRWKQSRALPLSTQFVIFELRLYFCGKCTDLNGTRSAPGKISNHYFHTTFEYYGCLMLPTSSITILCRTILLISIKRRWLVCTLSTRCFFFFLYIYSYIDAIDYRKFCFNKRTQTWLR